MSHRSLVLILLVAMTAAAATAKEQPAAETKRGAYVVKHALAKDLASVLAKHFAGAAEIQAGPEGTGHTLLVNAPPAVFEEIMKTIELLDRRPHTVAVEVFLIELPAKKPDDKDAPGIDEMELSGALADVARTLDGLQRKGQVANVKHVRLTTQEARAASLMLGAMKPYTFGGLRTVNYRNTGTRVRATPLVAENRTITLDLQVEDSRMISFEDGKPPEFPITSLTAKIPVDSGNAVLAKDVKFSPKPAEGRMLIVVGARLIESK